MKIVSLLENTTNNPALQAEHGLSLYIETERYKILFDMGQTDAFAANAEKLHIHLADVDIAILSHGHYDHGGGLAEFLKINQKAAVYVQKDAFLPHYNGTEKYIGLNPALEKHPRIVFTDKDISLGNGLTLLSSRNHPIHRVFSSFGLTEKTENRYIPDDFRHEQYLLMEENGQKILLSGCSHQGILNIMKWFSPDVLIGGFHFSKMPLDGELLRMVHDLNAYETTYYTCHCTGETQFSFMKVHMPNLFYLSCGEQILL